MRWLLISGILILGGTFLLTVAVTIDLFFNGTPGYGWKQMVCIILGIYTVVCGVRVIPLPSQKSWDLTILIGCLAGTLAVGLKPEADSLDFSYEMFSYYQFSEL